MMRWLIGVGCWGAMLADARPETIRGGRLPVEARTWRIQAERSRVDVVEEEHRTLLRVTCPGGIGALTAALPEGPRLRHLTIRLEYGSGKPFRDLERLTVEAGDARWDASFTPDRSEPGDPEREAAPLRFRRTDAGLDVDLPMDRVRRAESITIRWVDYWRR